MQRCLQRLFEGNGVAAALLAGKHTNTESLALVASRVVWRPKLAVQARKGLLLGKDGRKAIYTRLFRGIGQFTRLGSEEKAKPSSLIQIFKRVPIIAFTHLALAHGCFLFAGEAGKPVT